MYRAYAYFWTVYLNFRFYVKTGIVLRVYTQDCAPL